MQHERKKRMGGKTKVIELKRRKADHLSIWRVNSTSPSISSVVRSTLAFFLAGPPAELALLFRDMAGKTMAGLEREGRDSSPTVTSRFARHIHEEQDLSVP